MTIENCPKCGGTHYGSNECPFEIEYVEGQAVAVGPPPMSKPILCVDFDGVIHQYTSKWVDAATIPDPPVPGALRWLWQATEWFDVQVYSSRSKEFAGREAMWRWMAVHSEAEFGKGHPMAADFISWNDPKSYPITFAHEKPAAFLTIDDRAICFEGDWNDIDPADLLSFKPWNKR